MIEPVAWVFCHSDGEYHSPSLTQHSFGMVPLHAIPDTHQIMPVKLTEKMIAAALPELMREDDEDKYRALGQLICVWDALIAAAKEPQCQS